MSRAWIVALTTLLLLLAPSAGNAQDRVFRTRYGKVVISVYHADSLYRISSGQLRAYLDLETTDLRLKLDPRTLNTGRDSLNNVLVRGFFNDIVFEGKLGLDYINTTGHPKQEFDTPGELTVNGITRRVIFQGTLEHREEGPGINCILYLHYDIPLAEFDLDALLPGYAEQGCIEIVQAILRQGNE